MPATKFHYIEMDFADWVGHNNQSKWIYDATYNYMHSTIGEGLCIKIHKGTFYFEVKVYLHRIDHNHHVQLKRVHKGGTYESQIIVNSDDPNEDIEEAITKLMASGVRMLAACDRRKIETPIPEAYGAW